MRIAQIAPLYEAVPPKLYGGTERVIAYLCDALVELGHDVTLFSSADSETNAELVAVRDQALRLDDAPLTSDLAVHLAMLDEVRRRSREFDVLHFHVELIHFPIFEAIARRTLTTIHGRLDVKDLEDAYARWPDFPLVAISKDQRNALAAGNWFATIPHGLPPQQYVFHSDPEDYLAFLGRVAPEKGPDVAIRIAQAAKMKLKMAAKVDASDAEYFESTIRPLLGGGSVEFIGEIGDADKSKFLGKARALLFPIDWPEPFGLVMIEALACGTPVIAWNRGSVPEVIDDGVTGFIVDSVEEALQAIARVHELDRRRIREVFEQRFSSATMACNYLQAYQRLIESDNGAAVDC
jgi:glycosyltransferase involved in cell wall biosynthesis